MSKLAVDKYVEDILGSIQAKLEARKRDTLNILEDSDKTLSEQEMLAYKWLMLTNDSEAKGYADLRYFSKTPTTYRKISQEMGYSEGKVYYVRRRLIDGINLFLLESGYGVRTQEEEVQEEVEVYDDRRYV